ncbi:MAG: hypothetical protein L6Q60_15620 [Rhodocyclaceae bacterium]|nr:hypothetical protein [Rhodocyclaceae bacterium]
MNLEKYQISVNDYERTVPRFEFRGFTSPGYCFLKASVRAGTPVFLCAQLSNYHGTSVTNAVENILDAAIQMLLAAQAVTSLRKKSLWDLFSDRRFEQQKWSDLCHFFSAEAIWIEHYPPGTGLQPEGSFSIVKFDTALNPSWSYVRKEKILEHTGLDEQFFNVPYNELSYEQSA